MIDAADHPAIEAVGQQLAPQDGGRVEITAGWIHLPLQHLAGIGEEVQVVGRAGDECANQGVAITPPGAADALQVVGRLRRH